MCKLDHYQFAELKSCCPQKIKELEQQMKNENGKEVVLIAYEKK